MKRREEAPQTNLQHELRTARKERENAFTSRKSLTTSVRVSPSVASANWPKGERNET
ncbi:MAG: hypothetical protein ACTS6G_04180 [Candidatus Hodgkinia cicadicola]